MDKQTRNVLKAVIIQQHKERLKALFVEKKADLTELSYRTPQDGDQKSNSTETHTHGKI